MLPESIQADIANAVVGISRSGAQGVLINGNLILTAAHCIEWTSSGVAMKKDPRQFHENIVTAQGRKLIMETLAVEPVSDIAVLGPSDDYEFCQEAEEYEEFCESTKPVAVCTSDFKVAAREIGFEISEKIPCYIYTHNKTWIQGTAQQTAKNCPSLCIEAEQRIENGTSGGPVVNEAGELLGVVSDSDSNKESGGSIPRPHLTLPVWVCSGLFHK